MTLGMNHGRADRTRKSQDWLNATRIDDAGVHHPPNEQGLDPYTYDPAQVQPLLLSIRQSLQSGISTVSVGERNRGVITAVKNLLTDMELARVVFEAEFLPNS